MTVLVTGGYGLVGSALQEEVKSNNYYFVGRSDYDLTDEGHVNELFWIVKPKIVVHLAAKVGGVYDNLNNNYDFFTINNKINTNILEACKKYKVDKLVNILSTCIFPDKGVEYPLTQSQLHNGIPHYSNIGYAYAKRMLHVGSELLSKKTGMTVVNLIPTNLYGKNDNYSLESAHVIPSLIHKAYLAHKAGLPLHIKGDGNAYRQFLYANDLAKVIKHFVENETKQKQVSCIVAPPESHEISISELVGMIMKEIKFDGEIVYESKGENGQLKKTVNDVEIKTQFPNVSFTTLIDGLSITIKHLIDNFSTVRK